MSRKYEPAEQASIRTILGSTEDQQKLNEFGNVIKDWIETGEDECKHNFESLLFIRSLNAFLRENEIINLKDFKVNVNKKQKELTITRVTKVQKTDQDTAK